MKAFPLAAGLSAVLSMSALANVDHLYSNTGSVTSTNNNNLFFAFDNPLVDSAGTDVFDTSSSLFWAATIVRPANTSFASLGIYTVNGSTSTTNGAFEIGRNTATTGFSIFDYMDNKGASSATARTGASPEIPMDIGTYTVVAEVQFTNATSGFIRAWITGTGSVLDLATPMITTTFSSGFGIAPDNLYLRIGSGSTGTSTFSNLQVALAENSSDRSAAFAAVVPEPGSAALLTVSAGVLGLVRRRRRIA